VILPQIMDPQTGATGLSVILGSVIHDNDLLFLVILKEDACDCLL
jgi:hypothetical protein